MFTRTSVNQLITHARRATPAEGELLYRFEADLTEQNPVGLLPEGLMFANPFSGRITAGPLAGARIWGVDHFLMRRDGVGVIDAPETISLGDTHIMGHARGYAVPPAGLVLPPLESLLVPGFTWPDATFGITGSVTFRSAVPELDYLNRTIAVIAGELALDTGHLTVEARAVRSSGAGQRRDDRACSPVDAASALQRA